MSQIHIGLSGYAYKPWHGEGRFYPPELKVKEFFAYYCARYDAVEMDGTWYRMPSEKMVEQWCEAPRGFTFSPKMHRNVTHMSRLKEDSYDSAKFFMKRLRPAIEAGRLGSVLVQLPPNLKAYPERLRDFLEMLPKTAKGIEGGTADVPIRYSVEFRNAAWNTDEIEGMLAAHNIGWVASETDDEDAVERDSATHAYFRLRRTEYDDDQLKAWAEKFKDLAGKGREVFIFCKHEDDSSPWIWANKLIEWTR